jgi:hypothetical protein
MKEPLMVAWLDAGTVNWLVDTLADSSVNAKASLMAVASAVPSAGA